MKKTLFLLPFAATIGYAQQQKPNVIIILVDDMGIGDNGTYGSTIIPTPNIDRLAHEGLQLGSFYSAAPVSSPARTGLLTGRCPIKYRMNTYLDNKAANARVENANYLDPCAPTMAHAFKNAGYATGHFGKWHMGGGRDVTDAPDFEQYGFTSHVSTYESPDPDPKLTSTNWIWAASDEVKRWNRTAYFIDRAIDFMKENKAQQKPFFLNLWPDDVHTPWVPEAMAEKREEWEKRPAFIPVMEELDHQLGRFFNAIDSLGLRDNTIVIYTADNGPAPSFNQERTCGKRGQKNSLYDGGINMPFIIRYPKVIEAGKVNNKTVLSTLDLYPSLCTICAIPTQEGYWSDGADYSKAFLGLAQPKRKEVLMWDFGRNDSYNKPRNPYHRSPHLAIRQGKWKLLCGDDASDAQLYDMVADPKETTDVASKHPKLVQKLSKQVCEWYKTFRFGM
jgi:arylsulfatase A-like enzyme